MPTIACCHAGKLVDGTAIFCDRNAPAKPTTRVDGVLWYHCRFCEHAANRLDNIKRHEAAHLGDRDFQCQYCDDTFTEKGYLDSHVGTHTGERPHGCAECGVRFTRRDHLLKHQQTHTGMTPYKCSACDYAAVTSTLVNRHIRHRHPGSGAKYINATGALGGPGSEPASLRQAPVPCTASIAGDTTLPVLDAAVSRARVSLPAATAPQADAPPPSPDIDIMDPELFVGGSLLRLLHATPEQQAVLLATEEYRHLREARTDTPF